MMNRQALLRDWRVRVRWTAVSLLLLSGTTAAAEKLQYPLSAAVSADNTLYVADRDLPGIWKVEDNALSIFFKASKQFRTPLNAVRCLAVDRDGRLVAGDSATRQVYRFDESGNPVPLLTNPTGIGLPMSIAVLQDGTLVIADLELHQVWKVPAAGGEPVKFAAVTGPRGLAVDAQDNIWVVSHGQDQLVRLSAEGKIEPVIRGRPFRFPHNVAVDAQGVAYLSDGYAKTIWKIAPGGEPEAWLTGEPLINPVGLAWRGNELLIVDSRAQSVFVVNAEGMLETVTAATQDN